MKVLSAAKIKNKKRPIPPHSSRPQTALFHYSEGVGSLLLEDVRAVVLSFGRWKKHHLGAFMNPSIQVQTQAN